MSAAYLFLSLVLTGTTLTYAQSSLASSTTTAIYASGYTTTAAGSTTTGSTPSTVATSASSDPAPSRNPQNPSAVKEDLQAEISSDKDDKVPVNTLVTLTCEASGGLDPYSKYSWFRDDKLAQGQVSVNYTFTSATKGSAEVTCTVSDSNGDTETSGVYTVTFSGASSLSLTSSIALGLSVWLALLSSATKFW